MHRVLFGLLLVVATTGPGFAQASNPLDRSGLMKRVVIAILEMPWEASCLRFG